MSILIKIQAMMLIYSYLIDSVIWKTLSVAFMCTNIFSLGFYVLLLLLFVPCTIVWRLNYIYGWNNRQQYHVSLNLFKLGFV